MLVIGIIELHNGLVLETMPEDINVCKKTNEIPDWTPVWAELDTGMVKIDRDEIKSLSYKEVENV